MFGIYFFLREKIFIFHIEYTLDCLLWDWTAFFGLAGLLVLHRKKWSWASLTWQRYTRDHYPLNKQFPVHYPLNNQFPNFIHKNVVFLEFFGFCYLYFYYFCFRFSLFLRFSLFFMIFFVTFLNKTMNFFHENINIQFLK